MEESKQHYDANGFMNVVGNPISKVGIFQYLGSEIGAPDPDRVYNVYRSADELIKSIDSFKLKPMIDEHEWIGDNGTAPEQKGVQGVIGTDVYFDSPYLRADLTIYSRAATNMIRNKHKVELSPAYSSKYVFEQGTFDGEVYDAIQVDLKANHLALVERGRTGSDVKVLDHRTFDQYPINLNLNNEATPMDVQTLLDAIKALNEEDKELLMLELVPAKVADNEKVEDEEVAVESEEIVEAVEAATAAVDVAEEVLEAAEEVLEAIEVVEEEVEAVTAEETMDSMRKKIKLLEGKVKSMDDGAIFKRIAKRDALAKSLARHVGSFTFDSMTVDQVAQYGVKRLGIKCAKGVEAVALDAWMQGRKADADKVTMDSAPVNLSSLKSKLIGK